MLLLLVICCCCCRWFWWLLNVHTVMKGFHNSIFSLFATSEEEDPSIVPEEEEGWWFWSCCQILWFLNNLVFPSMADWLTFNFLLLEVLQKQWDPVCRSARAKWVSIHPQSTHQQQKGPCPLLFLHSWTYGFHSAWREGHCYDIIFISFLRLQPWCKRWRRILWVWQTRLNSCCSRDADFLGHFEALHCVF
jgi:hypothetical protein